jgi:hypothetical protein
MGKFIILDLTPEIMMDACLTLANIIVKSKKNPELLKVVPSDNVEEMVMSIFRVLMERSDEQSKGVDPTQEKIDEEKLEQSVSAAMEALLKASGK